MTVMADMVKNRIETAHMITLCRGPGLRSRARRMVTANLGMVKDIIPDPELTAVKKIAWLMSFRDRAAMCLPTP